MELPFPYVGRQVRQGYIVLPMNGAHNTLREGVQNSLLVGEMNYDGSRQGSIRMIQETLIATYGGTIAEYPWLKTSTHTYRLQLPPRLRCIEVVNNPWLGCTRMEHGRLYLLATKNFQSSDKNNQFSTRILAPFFRLSESGSVWLGGVY